jgi:uncharacterized protein (TIGR00288 family)
MSVERVMLLIDADNVSVDVMEQAVRLVHQQHGGLHVRRAYCTAESAVKHQAVFKRLAIKPMVNLAAGKNSTDIALAVDAIDLVLAERPDVVVIASSDSDFAPLVQRLREKGCVVRGIGQQGKTGAETLDVYDDFTVLEHRGGGGADAPARKRAPARGAAAKKTPAAKAADGEPAAKRAPRKVAKKVAAEPGAQPAEAVRARRAAAKTVPPAPDSAGAAPSDGPAAPGSSARKRARAKPAETLPTPAAPAPAAKAARKRATRVEAPAAPEAPASAAVPGPNRGRAAPGSPSRPDLDAVLACLPELAAGQALAINVAVQRLREARLLGRNTPSTRFFAALSERLELRPAGKPSQVLLRR